MTFYDPESDPRWIPPPGDTEVFPEPDRAVEDEFERLARTEAVWQDLENLFSHPGWAEFHRIIDKDREGIDSKLIRVSDPQEWKFIRGQLLHAEWVLGIPDEVRRQHRIVADQLRELAEKTMEGADGRR